MARGYKVDKDGDIDGKGHAKRDVVEWMFPPLWPWKVISLPFRGPRPTLKGEEPLQLRLMDDIVLPQALLHPDRPPYASSRPASYNAVPQTNGMPWRLRNPAYRKRDDQMRPYPNDNTRGAQIIAPPRQNAKQMKESRCLS